MLYTSVKENMTSIDNFKSISIDDTIKKAVKHFIKENESKERYHIVGVYNHEDRIIAILSIGDILKAVKQLMKLYSDKEMKEIASLSSYGHNVFDKRIEKRIDKGVDLKVRDLIEGNSPLLRPKDSLSMAFDVMLESNLSVLPIVNDDKNVIGVIRNVDLLDCVVDFIDD